MSDAYTYKIKLELDTSGIKKSLNDVKGKFKGMKIPKLNVPTPNFKGFKGLGSVIEKVTGKLGVFTKLIGNLGPVLMAVKVAVVALTTAFVAYGTALVGVSLGLQKVLKWGDALNKSNNLFKATFDGMIDSANRAVSALSGFTGINMDSMKKDLTSVSDLMSAITSTGASKLKLGVDIIKQASVLSKQYGVSMKDAEERLAKAYTGETEGLIKLGVKIVQGNKEFKNAVRKVMASRNISMKEAKAYVISSEVWKQSSSAMKAYSKNMKAITTSIDNFYVNLTQKLQNMAQAFTNAFSGSKAGKLIMGIMDKISNSVDSLSSKLKGSAISGTIEIIYGLFKPIPALIDWISESVVGLMDSFDFKVIGDLVGSFSESLVQIGILIGNVGRVVLGVVSSIINILGDGTSNLINTFNIILKFVNFIINSIARLIEGINGAIKDLKVLYNSTVGYFKRLLGFGDNTNAFSNAGEAVKKTAKDIKGILDDTAKNSVEIIPKINPEKLRKEFSLMDTVQYGTQEAIKMSSTVLYADKTDKNIKYNKDTADNTKEIVDILKQKSNTVVSSNIGTVDVFA